MYNRCLERRMEIVTDEQIESKKPIELEYYIIESNLEPCWSNNLEKWENKVYGIEIAKRVDEINYESEMLKEISFCKKDTIRILDKLALNTVTPVELAAVIDDILAE